MTSIKDRSKTLEKKEDDECSSTEIDHNKKHKMSAVETKGEKDHMNPPNSAMQFSRLLEGVVLVLSGFVNPERGTLRSQALEMGAVYKPDWTSDCTLLVCAFPHTPKFRQVRTDCGTIVSKEWISECYNHKRLVEIDQYLMHAGKPWRKSNLLHEICQDQDVTPRERPPQAKKDQTAMIEDADDTANVLSLSQVKEWAIDDFKKTVSWLESQEVKPKPDEIKKIAAEGIITCLQDAIEALRRDQNVSHATEQWSCVPSVVKELSKLQDRGEASLTKNELTTLAINCKQIYSDKLEILANSPTSHNEVGGNETDDLEFDSDATIEMTEEEIDLACQRVDGS